MPDLKQWIIQKLGLEPGDPLPKVWGWKKFSWLGVVKQQLLLHPAYTAIPIGGFACFPRWWTALLACWVIMAIHEATQFLTMPKPEPIKKAVCARDKLAWEGFVKPGSAWEGFTSPDYVKKILVNGRHLNAAERACDVFGGGTIGGLVLWFGYLWLG